MSDGLRELWLAWRQRAIAAEAEARRLRKLCARAADLLTKPVDAVPYQSAAMEAELRAAAEGK